MKLGFCTPYSEDIVKFAGEAGFKCLEIFVGGELDLATVTDDQIKKAREVLDANGIVPSSIFSILQLEDSSQYDDTFKLVKRAMDVAEGLGTDIITGIPLLPADASLKEKLEAYKASIGTFAKEFEARGMKLAFENWPAGGRNIACLVANWRGMFDVVPSEAVGLEYDPSHMYWQRMDHIQALKDYADRVYMMHAKDTQIFDDVLATYGSEAGKRWWRFRIPGYGELNWKKIFQVISDIDYTGDMVIEHEDQVFDGDRRKEGFKLGLKYLEQFIIQK